MKWNDLRTIDKTTYDMFAFNITNDQQKEKHTLKGIEYISSFNGEMVESGLISDQHVEFRFILKNGFLYFQYTEIPGNWSNDIVSVTVHPKNFNIHDFIDNIVRYNNMDNIKDDILASSWDRGKKDDVKAKPEKAISPFATELVIVANNTVAESNLKDYKAKILGALNNVNTYPQTPEQIAIAVDDVANIATAEKIIKKMYDGLFTGDLSKVQLELNGLQTALAKVKKPLVSLLKKRKEDDKKKALADGQKAYLAKVNNSQFAIDITQALEQSIKGKKKAESKNKAMKAVIDLQAEKVIEQERILSEVLANTKESKQYFTSLQYNDMIIASIKRGEKTEAICDRITTQAEVIKLKQEQSKAKEEQDKGERAIQEGLSREKSRLDLIAEENAKAQSQKESIVEPKQEQAPSVGKSTTQYDFSNVKATTIKDGKATPLEFAKNILIEEPNEEARPPKFEAVVTSTVSTTERTQHLDESCLNTVDQLFKQGIEQYNLLLEQGEIEYYSEINDGILTVQARIKPDE